MLSIFKIPEELRGKARRFFGPRPLSQAEKFLRNSRVTISFKKGSEETYFICSGIIKDDRSYESKVVYKKRLEGTDQPPLTSQCDCTEWTEEEGCSHTCALYMLFLWHEMQDYSQQPEVSKFTPPISIESSFAASVLEYGTLVKGPYDLQNANGAPTYSSLQYLLHNKKTINFPIPKKLEKKLYVNIFTEEKTLNGVEKLQNHKIRYTLRDEKEEIFQISILENLYIFNWRDGEAFHLEGNLKEVIQKFRLAGTALTTRGVLNLKELIDKNDELGVRINDVELTDIKLVEAGPRIEISPAEKKTQVYFDVYFQDNAEVMINPPEVLKCFAFTGGHLAGFKKKREAYHFLDLFSKSAESGNELYRKTLLSNSSRETIHQLLDFNFNADKTFEYDVDSKSLISFDNVAVNQMLSNLFINFGELFFRFSVFSTENKYLRFTITHNSLQEGLNEFYTAMKKWSIPLFYNRNEISKWSSKVRFERRTSTTKWFDLELHLSEEDLTMLQNVDIDAGISFSKNGIVLLDREQKNLARFLQKYTQYENDTKYVGEDKDNKKVNKFVLPFSRARIFELFELKKLGLDGALTEDELALCHKLATLKKMPRYDLPPVLDGVLRPYQQNGYNWLKFLYENKLGACLADDMGLGKTLQTISFLTSELDNFKSVLIVCPVTILLNWEKEFKKFTDLDIHVYHGGERTFPEDKKVIITSYGVMKREIEGALADREFDVLVLDEVQHLKNIRSQGAYAARKIKANFRICLTGTPVENDLSEFYNILDLSVPGIWGDLQFIRTNSSKKSRLLAKKTAAPFILRRTKDQVLQELPPKIENNIYLNFEGDEKESYVNSLISIRKRIESAPSKKKYGEILRGLLELRQSCLWQGPREGKVVDPSKVISTKLNFLTNTLEQILEEGHQAIIFSQFTTYLDIIQYHLREKHWKLSRIDGSQSIKKRQEQVDEFQDGKTKVFLISLKAGGVGLNLTAASYVFIMDPWWNPAVEQQAIDRAHRIGQKNKLTVYRPIIKTSVEEKVIELQDMKKELFKDLLSSDDDEMFSGKLTMKDFEMLLGD